MRAVESKEERKGHKYLAKDSFEENNALFEETKLKFKNTYLIDRFLFLLLSIAFSISLDLIALSVLCQPQFTFRYSSLSRYVVLSLTAHSFLFPPPPSPPLH